MGYFSSDKTITVDSSARTYKQAFVPKYAKELAKGNTICLKTDITNGVSVLRVSHDSANGISRHLISVEDIVTDPTTGVTTIVKDHRVLSHPTDNSTREADLELLATGVDDLVGAAALQTALINGEL